MHAILGFMIEILPAIFYFVSPFIKFSNCDGFVAENQHPEIHSLNSQRMYLISGGKKDSPIGLDIGLVRQWWGLIQKTKDISGGYKGLRGRIGSIIIKIKIKNKK